MRINDVSMFLHVYQILSICIYIYPSLQILHVMFMLFFLRRGRIFGNQSPEVDVIEAMEEGEDVQLKVAVMWDGNDYYKPHMCTIYIL